MRSVPHCTLVRSYVLNNLRNGPARVAYLVRRGQAEFGFSRGEIESAAKHFAVVTQVKRGQKYRIRPTNLFAIWWGLDRAPDLVAEQIAAEQTSLPLKPTSAKCHEQM